MIFANKFLLIAVCLAIISMLKFTSNKYLFLLLLTYLVVRLIIMRQWKLIGLLILVSGIFILKINTSPQFSDQQYKRLVLKINPTEFKDKGDFYTGVASTDKEKFSFLINKDSGQLKQTGNEIIYLSTNDFKINDILGPTNSGEINFQKYYFKENIFRSIKIKTFQVAHVNLQTITDKILLLRWRLSEYFKQLPDTLRFNANSLLIGLNESTDVSKDYLITDFTKLGIIHLFSLSGMHLLLLISFCKWICNKSRLCTIETLETMLFAILPVYSILVGTNTSICRATILVLTKIIFEKSRSSIAETEIFGISLIIGLLLDPKCLLMLGGQLTYLLSFALIYLKKLSLIRSSIMINLLCMPLIILNNYELNLTTIPVNIFVVPIFEYFILPSTMIFAVIGKWTSPFTNYVDCLSELIYKFCHYVAQINFFQIITGEFCLPVVMTLVLLILIIITDKKYQRRAIKLFLLLFLANLLWNKFPLTGQVTLIDIGQGDSILITTPIFRQTFLIDTGGKLAFGGRKIKNYNVDKITIPYLKSQGINKIDAIFMSHQDSDHIGDLSELLKKFPVQKVYFGNGMQNNPKVEKVLLPYDKKIKIQAIGAGDKLQYNAIKFKVLAPLVPGLGENKDSMVLTTRICNKDWIFTGDLNREKEIEVMDKFHPHVDYLKVGHHGSKTSSDPKFIQQIKPKIAFISVGRNNRYGHPNKETIDTLKANHVQILKTAEYGMITWQYDFKGKYKIKLFLGN